jgi:hypothetical protein
MRGECRDRFERALATLQHTARLVVWLHDVEGYTHSQIGELLGGTASFEVAARASARPAASGARCARSEFAMHADIDELLSLRDGEPVAAEVVAHVSACIECNARLARLQATKLRVQSLPDVMAATGNDDWREIERRIASLAMPRRVGACGSASLRRQQPCHRATAGLRMQDRAARSADALPVSSRPSSRPTHRRSRSCSIGRCSSSSCSPHCPSALPERATALPIDCRGPGSGSTIGFRVGSAAPASEEAERFWRDRIELMNSLVQLRYVEAQRRTL